MRKALTKLTFNIHKKGLHMYLIAVRVTTLLDNKIQLELDIVDPINPTADLLRQYIATSIKHLESDCMKTSNTRFFTVSSDWPWYQLSSLAITITYNQSLLLSVLAAIEEYFSINHQDYYFAFGKSKIYDDLEDDCLGYPLSCDTESQTAKLELPPLKYLPQAEEYIRSFQINELSTSDSNSKRITNYVLQEISVLFSKDLEHSSAEKHESQYQHNGTNLFSQTTKLQPENQLITAPLIKNQFTT